MNKKIGFIVLEIIVLAGVFYGGMTYGGNNVRAALGSRSQAFGQNGGGRMRGNGGIGGMGFTAGQIISIDANSITISMQAAPGSTGTQTGSKIIFLDANTKITKSVSGTASDLTSGEQVSVTGAPNADGSINAQSVQIRPQITPRQNQ